MSERLVIDASVAAKWFLADEADAELADVILQGLLAGDVEAHAPDIFVYEVCGSLCKAYAKSRTQGSACHGAPTEEQVVRCARVIYQLPIKRAAPPSAQEAVESLKLAIKHTQKYYDMLYLRLAQVLECQWCTADRRALATIPRSIVRRHAVLLEDYRGK